ncbi:hypothetical protein D3C81_205640 [compost metagenome]
MRLSKAYNDAWFEGEGKKCCFVCGKEVETGCLWYGSQTNPNPNPNLEDSNKIERSTVVCGGYCQEKFMQLLMDSLIDTREHYTNDIPNGPEEELFMHHLREDMMQILELALSKKLSNIRLRREQKLYIDDNQIF